MWNIWGNQAFKAGFICLTVSATAPTVWAGAWTLPKGDGQIILTNVWADGQAVFDDDGNKAPITDFSKVESRLFFEHGLTQKITITGNAAYQTINYDSPENRFTFKDFDQTELGVRYLLKSKPGQAISAQVSYILDGGPVDNILDINGGDDQVELRAMWGQSTDRKKHNLFVDTQLAGRLDLSGRYDTTHFDVTLGYKPSDKWLIMLQNYTAVRESESEVFIDETRIVPRQSQWKVQPSITYNYNKKHSLQLGYTKTVRGRNIVEEEGLTLGYWWRY